MRVRSVLVWASGAALSLGLVSLPAAATAEDNGSSTATVTQSAGVFTVTLPGVGMVSFGVDPTTHALTGLTVTPSDPSVTAGAPVVTEEGVQVRFDTASGTEFLEVEVEQEGAVPQVTAEVALPEDTENGDVGENEAGHDGAGDDGPDNAAASGKDGQQTVGTAPTTAPDRQDIGDGESTTTTTTPNATVPSVSTEDGGSADGGSSSPGTSGDSTTGTSQDGGSSGGSGGSGSGGSGSDG
jgi:uncharacterized membrane protein YgcG